MRNRSARWWVLAAGYLAVAPLPLVTGAQLLASGTTPGTAILTVVGSVGTVLFVAGAIGAGWCAVYGVPSTHRPRARAAHRHDT